MPKKIDRKFETAKGRLLRNIPIVAKNFGCYTKTYNFSNRLEIRIQNFHKSEISCFHRKGKGKFRINPTCHVEKGRDDIETGKWRKEKKDELTTGCINKWLTQKLQHE